MTDLPTTRMNLRERLACAACISLVALILAPLGYLASRPAPPPLTAAQAAHVDPECVHTPVDTMAENGTDFLSLYCDEQRDAARKLR